MPEFAPFAYSLARRVGLMLKKGTMRVDSVLWKLAVEKILLNLVDSETEAHEEILNTLHVAQSLESDALDVAQLGGYLDTCLQKSAKSRQLYPDRAIEREALPCSFRSSEAGAGAGEGLHTDTSLSLSLPLSLTAAASMEISNVDAAEEAFEDRYGDGVYPAYARLAAACPAVLDHAPIVSAYLGDGR